MAEDDFTSDFLAEVLSLEETGVDVNFVEFLERQELGAEGSPRQLEDLPQLGDLPELENLTLPQLPPIPFITQGPQGDFQTTAGHLPSCSSPQLLAALRMPSAPATLSSSSHVTSSNRTELQGTSLWELSSGEVERPMEVGAPQHVHHPSRQAHPGAVTVFTSPFSSQLVQAAGDPGMLPHHQAAPYPLEYEHRGRDLIGTMGMNMEPRLHGPPPLMYRSSSGSFQPRHSAPPLPPGLEMPLPALQGRVPSRESMAPPPGYSPLEGHARHVSDPDLTHTHRTYQQDHRRSSLSMPADFGVVKQPMKHTKRFTSQAGMQGAGGPSRSDSNHLPLGLESRSKSDSIRVVSGRGEFDFPAKKPKASTMMQRRHMLKIRSNQLLEPLPPPWPSSTPPSPSPKKS